MPGSYNRVILVGNLTRDPEIRYVGSGAAVTKFTLAVNRRSKNQEETTFVDIVAWDKLAETANTYLHRGSSVLIEGRLSIRKYEDKDGNKRSATEIVASSLQMLDRRGDASASGGSGSESSGRGQSGTPAADEDEVPFDDEPPF